MMHRAWICYWLLAGAAPLLLSGCGGSHAAPPASGKSAAELISAGEKLLAENKLDDALAAFDGAVDSDPNSAQARQRRALAYLRLGKPAKAVDDCDAALKINGKLTDAYFTRGQAEEQLGETDKAAADFSAALDSAPDRADILAARAALYQQMAAGADHDPQAGAPARKRLDGALKDLDKALKIQPGDTACLVRRAEIFLDSGDYQAAIDDCDKALEIDRKLTAARILRARGLIEKGDTDKAVADCTAAIEADGKGADAYALRAKARVDRWYEMRSLAAIADCGKAVDDCGKALSLSGQVKGDAEALRRVKKSLAVVHELCGILYDSVQSRGSAPAARKAFDEYSQALSLDGGLTDALVRRALNRAAAKDYSGALADCNRAIDIDRSRPEGYFGRGRVYRLQTRFAEAANDLDEAATRRYPKAYGELAEVYFNMANAELVKLRTAKDQAERAAAEEKVNIYRQKCIESATKGLEANRHAVKCRLVRGLAHADVKKLDMAYNDLSEVIREDPLASKAYFYRGVVCLMARRPDVAIKDFTRAVELQPNYVSAYKNRADAYRAVNDPISARADLATFQQLVKLFREEQNYEVEHPAELYANPGRQSLDKLGPEFEPLIAGWKDIEKKLDGILKK